MTTLKKNMYVHHVENKKDGFSNFLFILYGANKEGTKDIYTIYAEILGSSLFRLFYFFVKK